MRPKEVRAVLDTMTVLVDTREQDTERFRHRLRDLPVQRAALDYGDYTYNALLPSGAWIHDLSAGRIYPAVSIERKMDLDELAQCFTTSRQRFEAEFRRAQYHGAHMWLLLENSTWTGILEQRYRTQMSVNSYMGSLMAMMTRYGAQVIMCQEWDSGEMIRRILKWELKERLERGDYG